MMTSYQINPEDFRDLMRIGRMVTLERSETQRMLEVEEADDRRIIFRLLNPRAGTIRHVFPRRDGTDIEGSGCTYHRFDGGVELRSEGESWRYLFV